MLKTSVKGSRARNWLIILARKEKETFADDGGDFAGVAEAGGN